MWSKSVTGGKYIFKEYVLFYGVAWYKVGKSTQPGPLSNQRKGGVNCTLTTGLHVRVSSDCVSSGHTSDIKNISNIIYGKEI